MQTPADLEQLRANLARIQSHLERADKRGASFVDVYRLVRRANAIEQRIAEVTP